MGFKAKKLIGYIRNDRLNRLKSYVDKYGESIVKIPLDDKGRTAMHLACRHSSIYCFAYLLKHKPNVMKTDADGNLPLHWALRSTKDGNRYAYTDIVLPLLKHCRDSQNVPNKNGKTGQQLLKDLGLGDEVKHPVRHKKSYDENEEEDDDEESDVDETDFVDVNNLWNERLREEFEYEQGEMWGRYDEDYQDDWYEYEPESYDGWTNRIASEYSRKHRPSVHKTMSSDSCTSKNGNTHENTSTWSTNNQCNFERECQKEELRRHSIVEALARSRQKSEFTKKYSRIFDRLNPLVIIRLYDLPWMQYGRQPQDIVEILLADINPSDFVAKKKCLRELQVQWHPDKFMQKCGNRVAKDEKEAVFAAVNNFSQVINAALDLICTHNNDN